MKREPTEEQRQKQRDATARHRARNREKINAAQRERRKSAEAKEIHRIKMAEWRANNPEKQKETRGRCYEKNKDRFNAERRERWRQDEVYRKQREAAEARYQAEGGRRRCYEKNKDRELARIRRYRNENPEKIKQYAKNYRQEHREYFLLKYQERKEELPDSDVAYRVRRMLKTEIVFSIPEEIIQIKRHAIKLKRELKNKKQ